MNLNQVEMMLYVAMILAKINKQKRKQETIEKYQRIDFGKDKSELYPAGDC